MKEEEAKEEAENIKCKEIKEKSREPFFRECKEFLEENEKNWEKLKITRENKQQENTRRKNKRKRNYKRRKKEKHRNSRN